MEYIVEWDGRLFEELMRVVTARGWMLNDVVVERRKDYRFVSAAVGNRI